MSYCRNCGMKLVDGAKFCERCGVAVSNNESKDNIRRSEFYGKVFKCPNCGEVIKSFVRNCPACGLEFRATEVSDSVREFALKLEAIEANPTFRREKKRHLLINDSISEKDEQKINLIKNFSIPNNTEDILEFMILASSNMDYSVLSEAESSANGYKTRHAYAEAWLIKIKQAYSKAQNTVGNNDDFVRIKSIYEQCIETLEKQKRKNAIKIIAQRGWPYVGLAILTLILGLTRVRETHTEEKRLKVLEAEIVECLSQNELVEAAGKVSFLYTNDSSLKKEWDTIQSSYIKQIQDRSESGTLLVFPPMGSTEALGKDYKMVEDLFRMSGFVKVTTEEQKDLLSDEAEKENTIKSIRIGNNEVFEKATLFSFTDGVVIKYSVQDKLNPPGNSSSLKGKNYKDVESSFVNAGFINIAVEELNESDILNGKGKVKEISIDGNTSFYSSESYFADAKVVIRYYAETSDIVHTPTTNETAIGTPPASVKIEKDSKYAYMKDNWNLYIATAITDSIIKIELWDKSSSSAKTVKYDSDYGTFKINDPENGFSWVDDEHTAFYFTFASTSLFSKEKQAIFTVYINDNDKNKGTNYTSDIPCYLCQHDDWHLYRAIPLTQSLMKIECWYRGSSSGTFLYGYDAGILNLHDSNSDFEWINQNHTGFTLSFQDSQNHENKKEALALFMIESDNALFPDVKSFMENSKQ